MNKTLLSVFTGSAILLSMATLSGCKSSASLADRAESPMVTDGHTTNGELLPRYFDSNTKLQVGLSNDDQYFYLRLIAPDRETQMKMFISGFEVWIDPTGKKKKTMGITFPIARPREQGQGGGFAGGPGQGGGRPQGMDPEAMRARFLDNQKELKLTGFPNLKNGLIPLENDQDVHLAVNWDAGNVMVYEAAIPLKGILGEGFSLSQQPVWGVQLVVTGLPMPSMPGGGMPGGGMPGGGAPSGGMPAGGRPSGMPGGAPGGAGSANMQALFESGTGFYRVQLAK